VRGQRVLIAAGNAARRRAMSARFENWAAVPVCAGTGEAALDLLALAADAGDPCRLAIVDLELPDMPGIALAEASRRDPRNGEPPFILMRSTVQRESPGREELGVRACLLKPISHVELAAAVRDCLGLGNTSAPVIVPPAAPPAAYSRPLRILLAEDNPVNRRLARILIEKQGHTVLPAENGIQAIDVLMREPVDLVLMDLQMPKMDGLEATAEIRRRENYTGRHLPIVALTAHAMSGDRERCLAAGMDAYLSKPIQVEELRRLLEQFASLTAASDTVDRTP